MTRARLARWKTEKPLFVRALDVRPVVVLVEEREVHGLDFLPRRPADFDLFLLLPDELPRLRCARARIGHRVPVARRGDQLRQMRIPTQYLHVDHL